jgi:hypothetical protein
MSTRQSMSRDELVSHYMASSGCDRESAELAVDRLSTALPCETCGASHPVSFHDVNAGAG